MCSAAPQCIAIVVVVVVGSVAFAKATLRINEPPPTTHFVAYFRIIHFVKLRISLYKYRPTRILLSVLVWEEYFRHRQNQSFCSFYHQLREQRWLPVCLISMNFQLTPMFRSICHSCNQRSICTGCTHSGRITSSSGHQEKYCHSDYQRCQRFYTVRVQSVIIQDANLWSSEVPCRAFSI